LVSEYLDVAVGRSQRDMAAGGEFGQCGTVAVAQFERVDGGRDFFAPVDHQ
jgi:hypothetical protein